MKVKQYVVGDLRDYSSLLGKFCLENLGNYCENTAGTCGEIRINFLHRMSEREYQSSTGSIDQN